MTKLPRQRPMLTSVVLAHEEAHDFHILVEQGDLALAQRDGDRAAGAYVAAIAQTEANEPRLLLRLAAANTVRTRVDEAELCFREVLEVEPGNTAALRGLIAVHRARDQSEMAFALEDRLFVDLPPHARVGEMIVAGDRWWADGHVDKAEHRYRQALRLAPERERARERVRAITRFCAITPRPVVPAPRDTLPGISA